MEWLKQQGPWCPALIEYLRRHHQQYDVLIFFTYLYAPTVLGLEIAPGAQHPRADRARRAGDSAGDLQGRLRKAGRALLPDRERAALRRDAVSRAAPARGGRRRRRRPAAAAALPANAAAARRRPAGVGGTGRRQSADTAADEEVPRDFPRICLRAARSSAAATGSTVRCSSTAAGSILARVAKS